MKKLVIFDLDGTLLNTIEDLGHASNYALEKLGFPTHNISSYPFYVGNGVTKLIERILPDDRRTKLDIERVRREFISYYDEHDHDYSTPYDGIKSLLVALQDKGVKLAVASNKYHRAVVRLVNHYFGEINWASVRGQEDLCPVKPDPSILFANLLDCPTPKADVLYVGDSGVDMETARRACVDSVGVTWGFRPAKELRENYATHIVDRPDDILDIVLNG
ncbi:MAG: HAD family hydrolase [Muribaculaceae bacterium]|nr:HAD family hydrolase [Muribaculaceae bacterium]